MPKTLDELRAEAAAHAKQLEAVHWLSARYLAKRWGISAPSVRKIPSSELPYLLVGDVRRYHPSDVEAYEAAHKQTGAAEEPVGASEDTAA